ncbi:MAG: hypothetical protein LBR88_00295 [Zoogloeaceae bacterium]|jgi:hypothetical protein|nr:hypothetical protein [Zoogloeaceae bacterium]
MQTLPIFVHIPKTSGTSVNTLIGCNYEKGEYGNITADIVRENRERESPLDPKIVLRHVLRERRNLVRCKLISGHIPYGIHRILGIKPQYYVFLRDPATHLVSYIRNSNRTTAAFLQHNMFSPKTMGYEFLLKLLNCASLSEMLDIVLAPDFCPTGNSFRNLLTHYVSGCWYTEQVSLTQLNVAIDNLRASTFVGLTEEFELSILMMAKKLKWRNVIPAIARVSPDSGVYEVSAEIRARLVRPLAYDQALYEVGQDIFHEAVRAEGTRLTEAAAQLREIHQQLRRESPKNLHADEQNSIRLWTDLPMPEPFEIARALNANLSPASPLGRWREVCAAA